MTEGPRSYFDSFANLLSGFGGEKDRTTQSQIVFRPFEDQERLEELYRSNHYAARIVDQLPNDATRRGFKVGDGEFDADLARLGLVMKLNLADRWARLYGGAAVILGIDDGQDTREAVNAEAVTGISYAYVTDRWSLEAIDQQNNPRLPGFGKPERYRVTKRDIEFEGASQGSDEERDFEVNELLGRDVHVSRMIRLYGVELPVILGAQQEFWGDSVLERPMTALSNISIAESAISNTLQMFTQAIFRKKGLANLVRSAKGRDELLSLFSTMNMSQSMLGMMIVDADGEDFERRSTTVSGMSDLYDRLAQSLVSSAHMPASKVFGVSPAGLSTDDKSGERNWNDEVQAHQEIVYVPAISYVATLLQVAEGGNSDPVEVEPVPLSTPTELEVVQALKLRAEIAAILIDRAVITPQDVNDQIEIERAVSADMRLDIYEDFSETPELVRAAAKKGRWSAKRKREWLDAFHVELDEALDLGLTAGEAEARAISTATAVVNRE